MYSAPWNVHIWHSGENGSDPNNTNRFLLSHGNHRSFREVRLARGRAWAFSGTDLRIKQDIWTDDLVDITRNKSKEVEGARERPYTIEYLSLHCDILLWSFFHPPNPGDRHWMCECAPLLHLKLGFRDRYDFLLQYWFFLEPRSPQLLVVLFCSLT